MTTPLTRRQFTAISAATAGAICLPDAAIATQATDEPTSQDAKFQFNYILGSCMYGTMKLEEIVPEVAKIGAAAIDIWPRVHGDQREQLDEMGEEAFAKLLADHQVSLGCITQYKLGPFGLKDELPLASRLGCHLIVTGAVGPKGLAGSELKSAVADFIEKMKPHLELAEANDVTIAIENHGNNLVDSPDSLRYLMDLRPNNRLAIALAPYHLPQDEQLLAKLIRDLGDGIVMFYAWQHGNGCMQAQPKDLELLQMPGRGALNFGPLVEALAEIKYSGWTEIFMHPFPRGIPILETTDKVSEEINIARKYLEHFLVS